MRAEQRSKPREDLDLEWIERKQFTIDRKISLLGQRFYAICTSFDVVQLHGQS